MLIIKKLRLQRGWTQAELAEFSGVSLRTIQRVERGSKPGLETLKSLAAVFDLDISDFSQEDSMKMEDVSLEEQRAFKQVREEKGFYGHLLTYVIIIAGLFVLNYFVEPDYIWAKWPALGWGLGIITHGVRVFCPIRFMGPEWEKKQVEKKLGRKL